MSKWIKSACSMMGVLLFSAMAYAGMTQMSGEVTQYEAGKKIAIKDDAGTVHALDLTKDSKVEGEVKVGTKVSVEAEGKKAHMVKAAAGG